MRKYLILPAAALILAMSSSALAQDSCCDKSKLSDGGCCGVNYFDGVSFKSAKLHKALTGKTVKASYLKCEGCKKALKSDGECCASFAGGKSYKSKVAYTLAKGKAVDTSKIECKGCQKAAKKDNGWCDGCKVGLVGNKKYTDKKVYEAASEARVILAKAVKTSKKCEDCAVAMVTDGTCEGCKVSFKDGKKKG